MLALAIAASTIGFFAYKNLNQIIGSLEEEIKPHYNLFLINKIDITIQEAEYAMERYVYSDEPEELQNFEDLLVLSIKYADTLKSYSKDSNLLITIDSLQNLVLNKGTILNQVADMDYATMEETFADLKNQISGIKMDKVLEDTVLRKKRSFLQRIFQKDDRLTEADTIELYDSREYKNLINLQLDSIAQLSMKKTYEQKMKEYSLQQDHYYVQARISEILSCLEKYELEVMREQANNAKETALMTNKYITQFAVAIPVMLVITLVVLIIYILRTRKYQEVLSNSRKNAIKLAKDKEQFLANMSHELRTPMNAIDGFAKILLKGDINQHQREYLTIIAKSTEHLNYILNDVLDYSKLKGGRINLEKSTFNPKDLVKETVRLLEDKAKEKGLILNSKLEELPNFLLGDPYRLRQILLNLISNAIKFTDEGKVEIEVSAVKISEEKINLQLVISDSGVGIPKSKQDKIFDEFEQVNTSDKQKGTGLGLTITKKLITIHQGKILVESEEGKGTTFIVTIPYNISKSCENTIRPKEQKAITQQHVLIADDEEFNRKLLMAICDEYGLTYDVASDGQETLDCLSNKKYDAVLLDFRMPKLSGLEVIDQVRKSNGLNKDSLVIGLTATVSEEKIENAHKVGIQHVLRKPFDESDLLNLLGASSKLKTNNDQTESTSNKLFDLTSLNKMGDKDFVKDMIETFVTNTNNNLNLLDDYFSKKDWLNISEILHKIIAPARHFKSDEVVDLLKNYELSCRKGNSISNSEFNQVKQKVTRLVNALEVHLQQTK